MSGILENGWYLRSDGYMTSECSYQRIDAMKGNRALDNHQKLVFVKFMDGNEVDIRVYAPHPGTCEDISTTHGLFICSACGCKVLEEGVDFGGINFCPDCGRVVKL